MDIIFNCQDEISLLDGMLAQMQDTNGSRETESGEDVTENGMASTVLEQASSGQNLSGKVGV